MTTARAKILETLEARGGRLEGLGDKSTPEEVWATWTGMSKGQVDPLLPPSLPIPLSLPLSLPPSPRLPHARRRLSTPPHCEFTCLFPACSPRGRQYKAGLGALRREGAIVATANTLELVPVADRQPLTAEPFSGKSPRGWAAPDAAVLFVGNLAFSVDKMELAAAIEEVGPGAGSWRLTVPGTGLTPLPVYMSFVLSLSGWFSASGTVTSRASASPPTAHPRTGPKVPVGPPGNASSVRRVPHI